MIVNEQGPVSVAYADGYSVAERLLEGVRFRMETRDNKLICTGVHPEDEDYMIQFSEKARNDWEASIATTCSDTMFDEDGNECWWQE